MKFYKKYDNGLRLVAVDMPGFVSVSCGILVKTGSINESEAENGISHFIEHTLFKGTKKRSAFEISDYIDRIGAQINAFTSKETTCYYTKSTAEHLGDSLEVLSDIFFDSVFDKEELEKEKSVIIEEINMCEDTPEDLCLDLLSESYYGNEGLGCPILGPAKNVKRFSKADIEKYMNKYYCADNVVISVAGKVDVKEAERLADELFASKFKNFASEKQRVFSPVQPRSLYKSKKIEQSHIAFSLPAVSVKSDKGDALNIANTVFGGGMSSRLFQKIREEAGLAYSVYSYVSQYKDSGVLEIYAGVNTANRDLAAEKIIEELKRIKTEKITESEFLRGKEQVKSAFIMSRESTVSQMLLYGRNTLFLDKEFDFKERMAFIENISYKDVLETIDEYFDYTKASAATVGSKRSALKL